MAAPEVEPSKPCHVRLGLDNWLGPTMVLVALSVVRVRLPMPVSRSGSMVVTVSVLVSLALLVALTAAFATKRYRPSKPYSRLGAAIVMLLAWLAIITAVRVARGAEPLQAFIVLQTTLAPLGAYFMFDAGWETPQRALGGVTVFTAVAHLMHLGQWNNLRFSDYLGNSINYSGLAVLAIPVGVHLLATHEWAGTTAPVMVASGINVFFGLAVPALTGSRIMTVVGLATFVISLVVVAHRRRALLAAATPTLLAIVALAVAWSTNYQGVGLGIYRLIAPPAHVQQALDNHQPPSPDGSHAPGETGRQTIDELNTERQRSDINRSELAKRSLDSIKRDPLIGDGVVFFPTPDPRFDTGNRTAHNFVLEHWNAYGLAGLILYLTVFALAHQPSRANRSPGTRRNGEGSLALTITGAMLAFSLVQPTALVTVIVMTHWVAVGALRRQPPMLEGYRRQPKDD